MGALVSAAISGLLIDRYGRKKVILGSAFAFGLGSLLMAVAPNLSLLMVGRFFVGLGVGSGSMTVPVELLCCFNFILTFIF